MGRRRERNVMKIKRLTIESIGNVMRIKRLTIESIGLLQVYDTTS